MTFFRMLPLFSRHARIRLWLLMLAMLITAMFEVVGVASIMPFIALLKNEEALTNFSGLQHVLSWAQIQTGLSIQILAGILTLILILSANASALITNAFLLRFSHWQSHLISSRLLAHYLHQPYRYFLEHNSATLSKNILSEVTRLTTGVVIPCLNLVARSLVVLCIIAFLIYMDPLLACVASSIIGLVYGIVFFLIRRQLVDYGKAVTHVDAQRYRYTSEAFANIKDILLTHTQPYFCDRFGRVSSHYAKAYTFADAFAVLPRYVFETVAFGGMVLLALYFYHSPTYSPNLISLLALYAFAGYRLLPAAQHIYYFYVKLRYNQPSLSHILQELSHTPQHVTQTALPGPLPLNTSLVLRDIHFAYASSEPTLKGITLTIPASKTIGFAGFSGAGKTTLMDVLLGLLDPSRGQMEVDGTIISLENVAGWQANIGYVPQHIHIIDDTIAKNVAFGVAAEKIDIKRVLIALERAQLSSWVQTLPERENTMTGDRGIRLSGGQRQRLGIARALYREPTVLVFDEATSALDSITENEVMQAIASMAGSLTILLIAHRLTTLRICETIHVMDQGVIVASGSYDALEKNSDIFRRFTQQYMHSSVV